ncbi:hypothetical protein JZU68_01505 [bacterium]|nr:hypothetical protein [bacterium]
MKTLRTDSGYVVILINKNKKAQKLELQISDKKTYKVLNASDNSTGKLSAKFLLKSEETKVIEFK